MKSQAHLLIAGWLGFLLCLAGTGCALISPPRTAFSLSTGDTEGVSAKALALYSQGLQAEMNLDFAEAATAYRKAIGEDPSRDRLYQRLTGTYLRTRRLQEAQDVFLELARITPDEPSVFRWLGLIYRLNEHPVEAESAYRRSMTLRPTGVDAYVELAALLAEADRKDEAIDVLSEAAVHTSKPEAVIDALGMHVLRETGDAAHLDPRMAQRVADMLHALVPCVEGNVEAGLKIASFYTVLKRYDDAEGLYRRLSEGTSYDSRIHIDWSTLTITRGRPEEALERLARALPGVDNPYAVLERLIDLHLLLAGQAGSPDTARTHRAEAIRMLERNRASTPDDAALLARLVVLRGEQGQFPEAIEELSRLERRTSTQRELRWMLVELADGSAPDEAHLERTESALEHLPRLPESDLFAGDLFASMGDKERARRVYRRALESEEDPSPDPYLRLALLESEDDPAATLAVIREGLEALPGEVRLLFAAGQAHSQQEAYEQAIDYFRRAADILRERAPELSTPFLLHYALTLQLSGRTGEAVELLSDDRLDQIDFLQSYTALAQGRMTDETRPVLLEVLQQLAQRHPGNPWVVMSLGLHHYAEKDYGAADQAFARVEPLAVESGHIPEDPAPPALPAVFYFWRGAALERMDRIEEADRQFRRALQVDENLAEAQNYLAYMWAERGKHLEEGLALINLALAALPGNGAFLDTRGWIYFMMGRYEEALVDLNRAAEIEEDAVIYDHLGDTYRKLGRMEEAVAAWVRALRLDPDNETYRIKLEEAGENVQALIESAASEETE